MAPERSRTPLQAVRVRSTWPWARSRSCRTIEELLWSDPSAKVRVEPPSAAAVYPAPELLGWMVPLWLRLQRFQGARLTRRICPEGLTGSAAPAPPRPAPPATGWLPGPQALPGAPRRQGAASERQPGVMVAALPLIGQLRGRCLMAEIRLLPKCWEGPPAPLVLSFPVPTL